MKIAIVGATGLVGGVMMQVLEERGFAKAEILLVASEKSVGKELQFNNKTYQVISIKDAINAAPDIAIFSAGSAASKQFAPAFAEKGTYVIDNSSCWRMYEHIPLIVPEVNAECLTKTDRIIANPNCSTIQLVLALSPLHKRFGIKRIVISTYQSVTGTGVKAVSQLTNERKDIITERAYPHQIDFNVIPHGGTFLADGYTTEEEKLISETRKILSDQSIMVSPTVVRVPVLGGHSESVNIEFHSEFDLVEVRELLKNTPGIVLQDQPDENFYPMPLFAQGKDEVFVGRLRVDPSCTNAMNMWIVSDNLRKGAATNAIQIAEYIISKGWVAS
ncbi:MAG: aspartate-semialdehyde dehydrogenase [Bacteroidota bacterium]